MSMMFNRFSYVRWYTVWDAKTGDLLASGPADLCARRLGYANTQCFISAVTHWLHSDRKHTKYIFQRELIPRSKVDSLPPPLTRGKGKKKQPAGAPTLTGRKG